MSPAEEIRSFMERHDLTQLQFAKLAGLPQSTVSQIMRGADARHSTVQKIKAAIAAKDGLPARRSDDLR